MQLLAIPQVMLAVAVLAGCASQSGRPPIQGDFDRLWQAAAERPEVTLSSSILAGELASRRGMHTDAARYYTTAAGLSSDAKIAARATQLALQADDAELAWLAAKRWIELAPDAQGAYEIAARLALRAEAWDDAVSLLRTTLERAGPEPGFALLSVAEVITAEDLSLSRAQELYAQVVEGQALSAEREYGRALVAYRFGDEQLAAAALSQALMLKPDWQQAQLLALRLHLQAGEQEQADRLIRDLHVAAPKDLQLRLSLGSLLLENERLEAARAEFAKALKIDPNNFAAIYALGLLDLDAGDLDAAETHFNKLLRDQSRASDASYYLGRIEEKRGNVLQAMQLYRNVQHGRRVMDSAIRQVVLISQQGELDTARQYLGSLRSQFPQESLRLYQVEGELLYQAGQDKEADAVYSGALQAYPDEADLLYGRAIVRERLGDLRAAEADLRRILKATPDDARSLNALGYMLSNHTDRLAEAETYIRQALQATPDDPAVIDSLGWLYFRQGRLSEARELLERAYAQMQDPEVAAHLGEVMWLQGEQTEARQVWMRALQEHPEHPVLRETVKRLDSSI